jgi:microcystin-dependent protein
MALQFIITDAGRAAIAQVGGAIGPVTLTKIALGSAGYTPLATRTALQTEIKRLDPTGSSVPVPGTIHMTAQDDSADSYSVKEIGLYTNNNVLFAVYSQTGVILTKGSTASALFALDFVMTNVPPGSVTVGDAGFSYAQANETRLGVLAIATTAEAQAGTVDTKIITPLKLAQVTATESRRGVIALATTAEAQALAPDATKALTVARLVDRTATTGRAGVVVLASSTETQTGTDANKAVTPASLASRTATDARAGIVELADNTETQTGTDATRAVTPAGLASRTATQTRAGIVELADNTETQTGTDTARAVTPASLASRTATQTRAGIVELADNTETQTGTDATRAVTPAALASVSALLVPPGAVMPFATATPPNGWLPCDGGVVSRTTYSLLFFCIGTTFGAGDGSTTFNLPDLRGYFVRGSGTNADGTAAGTFGAKQADAFQGHIHTTSGELPTNNSSAGYKLPSSTVNVATGNQTVFKGTLDGAVIYHSHTISGPSTDGTNGAPRTASETRPRNIAMLYCIKF